jgi:hypothetical protein
MLGNLLSGGLGNILGGVNSIAKTFVGDKAAKEAGYHAEQMEIQKGYQAEFLAPEKVGIFNQIVDAANRLVRPLFTYGIVAMFIWAAVDPINFTMTVQALQIIPELLWYIMMTIIGFWFGGRLLEKAPMRISKKEIVQGKEIAKTIVKEREDFWEDKYEQVDKDIPKTTTNPVVTEWQAKSVKKTPAKAKSVTSSKTSAPKPKPKAAPKKKTFLGMTVTELDEDEFQDER